MPAVIDDAICQKGAITIEYLASRNYPKRTSGVSLVENIGFQAGTCVQLHCGRMSNHAGACTDEGVRSMPVCKQYMSIWW